MFDLVTHKRDGKGNIVRENPYVLHVVDGVQRFERPPGSGNMYDAQGNLMEEGKKAVANPVPSSEELSDSKAAEMLAKENEELKAKLAALEAQVQPKSPAPIDLDKVLESKASDEPTKDVGIQAAKPVFGKK